MAKIANDVKAADIKVLFVKPLVYWTRFFIIATAFSRPQIGAIRYADDFALQCFHHISLSFNLNLLSFNKLPIINVLIYTMPDVYLLVAGQKWQILLKRSLGKSQMVT